MRLSILAFLLIMSCRSADQPSLDKPVTISLLLEDDLELDQIRELGKDEVRSGKKISRTQNLWMVTINRSSKNIDGIIEEISKNKGVIEIREVKEGQNGATNISNSKKSKAKLKK